MITGDNPPPKEFSLITKLEFSQERRQKTDKGFISDEEVDAVATGLVSRGYEVIKIYNQESGNSLYVFQPDVGMIEICLGHTLEQTVQYHERTDGYMPDTVSNDGITIWIWDSDKDEEKMRQNDLSLVPLGRSSDFKMQLTAYSHAYEDFVTVISEVEGAEIPNTTVVIRAPSEYESLRTKESILGESRVLKSLLEKSGDEAANEALPIWERLAEIFCDGEVESFIAQHVSPEIVLAQMIHAFPEALDHDDKVGIVMTLYAIGYELRDPSVARLFSNEIIQAMERDNLLAYSQWNDLGKKLTELVVNYLIAKGILLRGMIDPDEFDGTEVDPSDFDDDEFGLLEFAQKTIKDGLPDN